MHPVRSKLIKVSIIFLSIMVLSACLELFYFNYHALRYPANSKVVISSQELLPNSSGFEIAGTNLVPIQDNASITYQFQNRYISKLVIEYSATDDQTFQVNLGSNDSAGAAITIVRTDTYNHRLTCAVSNVGEHIQSVNLVFPTQGISIKSISLTNEVSFNTYRYVFMVVTGMLFAFVLFSRKIMAERIEIAFLITALMLGTIMILLMPLKNPVTWDDDTHFGRIYEQSYAGEIEWTQGAYDYGRREVPLANTIEEKADVMQLLNKEDSNGDIISKSDKSLYIPYNYLSYLPQSITMFLARSLHMSFTSVLTVSKMGGLLFYSLIVCAAISIAKFGKRIISVVALMPTPLFMAANFSYDPFLIALSILAFTVFTIEYFDLEHKISLKNMIIFLVSIILACCTKATYIPLMLIILLLPEQKFQSKKNMYLFRLGILAVFVTIMATFVIPTLINPSTTGDLRGGNTSVAGQMHFILNDPIFFARLLMKNIWDTLGSYFCGTGTYTNFAYLGQIYFNICAYLTIIVIMFSVFTDASKNDKFTFKRSSKIYILLLIFATMCLIWTALYIAFTPVGSNFINGVQSRYYLPLVIPLLFMVRSSKIETSIRPITLNRIVFGICIFICLFSTYDLLLKPFCF